MLIRFLFQTFKQMSRHEQGRYSFISFPKSIQTKNFLFWKVTIPILGQKDTLSAKKLGY